MLVSVKNVFAFLSVTTLFLAGRVNADEISDTWADFIGKALDEAASYGGNCDKGPFERVATGTGTGDKFCRSNWPDGAVITGLEVWSNDMGISGLKFRYNDLSWTNMLGDNVVDAKDGVLKVNKLEWDQTDTVVDARLELNPTRTGLGYIYMKVKSGASFTVGKEAENLGNMNVHAGILLGAFGRADKGTVYQLGFSWLKTGIEKATISDIEFEDNIDDLNKRMQGLETMTLDYAYYKNNQDKQNSTFLFQKETSRTTSRKLITQTKATWGLTATVGVEASMFGMGASASTSLKYEKETMNGKEDTEEENTVLKYGLTNQVPPGGEIWCKATVMKGKYEGKYTSKINLLYKDGSKFSIKSPGKLQLVAWSQADSMCDDQEIPRDGPVNPSKPVAQRAIKFVG
ncbi:hypothetical protein BDV95DRAFT_606420 [Massariosphaeria phaeospora]|uniref:Jacalin-type lectin domain-containing protein n=1 Tax=Massariosphaeria phaeospora TaxID=100035 RepID=A0A7C8I695_9PLEO|nr:hypothetical protein BDV95DRAFT_606420 [Massariosphaeria phaeospora]